MAEGDPADLGHRPPTDLDVLRLLAGRCGAPVPAVELGGLLGIPADAIPTRLASLVSLGLVEERAEGRDAGYAVTERGMAEITRRETGGGEPPADGIRAFLASLPWEPER